MSTYTTDVVRLRKLDFQHKEDKYIVKTSTDCICIQEGKCLCGKTFKKAVTLPCTDRHSTGALLQTMHNAIAKKTWKTQLTTDAWKKYCK